MATKKFDRKAMRNALKERQEEKADEQAGGGQKFDFYLEVPEGVNRFFPKGSPDGINHLFNIVPFKSGGNWPTKNANQKSVDKGEWAYDLSIWYHKKVGPEEKQVPCLARNYGKDCPVCERMYEKMKGNQKGSQENKDLWGNMGPKLQNVWNVRVIDKNGDPIVWTDEETGEVTNPGVMVLNLPFGFMKEKLDELENPPMGGRIYYVLDDDEGRVVSFKKKTKGDSGNYDLLGHQLLERPKDFQISDEDMESATCLDECIKEYTYQEIVDEMDGTSSEPSEPSEPASEEKHDVGDDVPMGDGPSEEDNRQDDTGGEEEVVYEECPHALTFGKDWDEYEECDTCPASDACHDKKKSMRKKK